LKNFALTFVIVAIVVRLVADEPIPFINVDVLVSCLLQSSQSRRLHSLHWCFAREMFSNDVVMDISLMILSLMEGESG
jgi:hypothetical protein